MNVFQEEYPQLYIAREIVEAMNKLPIKPSEPKKPTPVERLPSKYEDVGVYLMGTGICFVLALIFLGISMYISLDIFILLMLGFGIGTIVCIYKTIKSIKALKTYKNKIEEHSNLEKAYEQSVINYKKSYDKYLKDKEEYDNIIKTLNTTEALLNYKLEQRNKFLQEKKSKERHKWFYDFDGPVKNNKIGRGEFFFKDYIEAAKLKGFISPEFDFYFGTIVEVSSLNIYARVSFFFPDILVLTPKGLLIDVEIDEPYTSDTKQPIHCIHSLNNGDSSRNSYFTNHNCSVIRFSERQIIKYPDICLNIILSFDDYARMPDNLTLPDDFKEKSWNEKEAIKMGQENFRDTY